MNDGHVQDDACDFSPAGSRDLRYGVARGIDLALPSPDSVLLLSGTAAGAFLSDNLGLAVLALLLAFRQFPLGAGLRDRPNDDRCAVTLAGMTSM